VPFRAILETLVLNHAPRVRAAVFCDEEGERVEQFAASGLDPYDVDLAGASFAPIASSVPMGACLRVAHSDRVHWIAGVSSGCYLVVVCASHGCDGAVRRDLSRTVAALASHM
jgi:hypothetical protein